MVLKSLKESKEKQGVASYCKEIKNRPRRLWFMNRGLISLKVGRGDSDTVRLNMKFIIHHEELF